MLDIYIRIRLVNPIILLMSWLRAPAILPFKSLVLYFPVLCKGTAQLIQSRSDITIRSNKSKGSLDSVDFSIGEERPNVHLDRNEDQVFQGNFAPSL